MADPRLTDQYDEIQAESVTAIVDGTSLVYDSTKNNGCVGAGLAVKLTAASTVGLTTDASHVNGKLVRVEWDGYCNVQVEGYVKLPGGLTATLTHGSKIVGATGVAAAQGYVRVAAPATLAEVAVARGMIVDNSDPTNCVIRL
jgi:hypothetical protein